MAVNKLLLDYHRHIFNHKKLFQYRTVDFLTSTVGGARPGLGRSKGWVSKVLIATLGSTPNTLLLSFQAFMIFCLPHTLKLPSVECLYITPFLPLYSDFTGKTPFHLLTQQDKLCAFIKFICPLQPDFIFYPFTWFSQFTTGNPGQQVASGTCPGVSPAQAHSLLWRVLGN